MSKYDTIKNWFSFVEDIPDIYSLIGTNKETILLRANDYKSLGRDVYCTEIKLKEDSGIDLSVQYYALDFIDNKLIISDKMERYNKLFNDYISILFKYSEEDIHDMTLYLESDTSIEDNDRDFSTFIYVPRNNTETILTEYLNLYGLDNIKDFLFNIMNILKNNLKLYYLGLMYSKKNFSIRYAYLLINNNIDNLKQFLKLINYKNIPEDDLNRLSFLENNSNMIILVDIDITEDKKIGDILGLELGFLISKVKDQKLYLYSETIRNIFSLIKEWDIVDNSKLELMKKCIFYSPEYKVSSRISHLKLRWNNGKRLPAKVYLEIKDK